VIQLGLVAGLVLGVLAGGSLLGLLNVRLRWVGLIFLALVLRIGTQLAIAQGVQPAADFRLPLYVGAFALLALACWLNRSQPGMTAIALGVASNGLAVFLNAGWMPVWPPSLAVAGLSIGDLNTSFHQPLPPTFGIDFFLHGGPIGDVIPLPFGAFANVASVGDILIGAGLGWFLFSAIVGRKPASGEGSVSLFRGRQMQALDQPVLLGSLRGPAGVEQIYALRPRRRHAYVRLAADARFAAFWLAQAISLFGDRLHQVALAVLAFALTNSPLLTGLVFLAATLPNLLLGPIAGTFVDRLDHRRVMIASDLVRAALVIALPFAAQADFVLIYPLVFLVTTVSLFFRPAKVAVVPRIVPDGDVMAANSAIWTADTLADIAGYPLAGVFVYFLGPQIGLAFFVDAATYLLSAILIASIVIPPVARTVGPQVGGAIRAFLNELAEGWRFLRSKPPLIQNTLVSALAQASLGVTLALTVIYAKETLDQSLMPYPTNFAAIDTVIGIGNLVGGLAVGLVGARVRKGWLVIAGFVVMGASTVALGLTSNVVVALAAATITGIANLVYVIPTQTIFIEMTPAEFMGRVVSFRSSLVFGSMMAAMAISGYLAELFPVGLVIAAFGALTALAGVMGAFLPAVRDPR
jgi:MFS transporter, DHA3 family, macrolide efflux protein